MRGGRTWRQPKPLPPPRSPRGAAAVPAAPTTFSAATAAPMASLEDGPGGPRSWDDLRKEARKIESDVDLKLAAYAKLSSSYGAGVDAAEAEHRAAELEGLLRRLADLNQALTEFAHGSVAAFSGHTLARHHEILHEYDKEFRRTRAAVSQSLEHAQLMGAGGGGAAKFLVPGGAGGEDQQSLLKRERGSILSATAQADAVIEQAQAASSALSQQRGLFTDTLGKVANINTRFPAVNNILNAIRRKKSKDTLVISAVAGICTIFLVVYWLFK